MPWRPRTRGETLLPSREEVNEEEEGSPSPLLFRWPRNAGVAIIIITAIYANTSAIFTNISITFPPLSTAVHSPATRCTLYLNMVLYASYYYPMMRCLLCCLSRFSLSYRWLTNCYDLFNFLVVMLLSFGAHHMSACVDPTVGLVVC